MENGNKILYRSVAFIVGAYFFFLCVVSAKPFLVTLVLAIILALLMVPVSKKLEKWGIPRLITSLFNTLFLMALSIGFVALISLQLSDSIADWEKIQAKIVPVIEDLKQTIYKNTSIVEEDLKLENSKIAESLGKHVQNFVNSISSFLGDYILTFIYIFFLLNYRRKFKQFFIKLFPSDKHNEVSEVLNKTATLTQGYLFGKFIMIIFLLILYSVGMGLTGVSNFIIISVIASLLTIIPYIGNIVGFILAIGLGYVPNGETTALIGIIASFSVGQFLESYVLQPYVVGNKVNLDPFMTILAVIAGGLLWGIVGMILAIPLLAIVNLAFNHVPPLKPISFLLSNNKGDDDKK